MIHILEYVKLYYQLQNMFYGLQLSAILFTIHYRKVGKLQNNINIFNKTKYLICYLDWIDTLTRISIKQKN